jgi:serine/threonine protein kinase
MEVALGGALSTHLSRNGSFCANVVQIYCAELFSALGHMHDRGCIHRDIKASNCVLDSRGHIKICDFSAAKCISDNEVVSNSLPIHQSEFSYTLIGTPEFMSPEMVLRIGYSYGADVWAAGVLIYELLTCRRPFQFVPIRDKTSSCPSKEESIVMNELKIFFQEYYRVDFELDSIFSFSALGLAAVEFLNEIFVVPEMCRLSARDKTKVYVNK